jgi:pimeloyl-ACP methyl ester carboxylesterase
MRRALALAALSALVACGCARWFPAPVPMRAVSWDLPPGNPKAKCLVVFLPGAGDSAEDFERNGFVAEVKRHGLSVDMVAANATLGYYARGTMPARLQADVIEPARARGYAQMWLVGMSMGGLGTFYYTHGHVGEVTGLLALAPFLGDDDVINEVRSQGGLATWHAPPRADPMNEDNYQREIWRWLQAVTAGREPGPRISLGYGKTDKLARQDDLLAAALPPDRVYRAEGGHAWTVWKVLLAQFLERSDFARDCR